MSIVYIAVLASTDLINLFFFWSLPSPNIDYYFIPFRVGKEHTIVVSSPHICHTLIHSVSAPASASTEFQHLEACTPIAP